MDLMYEGRFKKLRTAVAGELLLVEARRALVFAIALSVQPPRNLLLGFLGALDGNLWPFNANWDASGPCVSFGSGWVLEPKGPSFPVSMGRRSPEGMLIVGSGGATLMFGGSRGEFGAPAANFNLSNNGLTAGDYALEGVGFLAWDIWASRESRLDPRGQPLVSFAPPLSGDEEIARGPMAAGKTD